MNKNFSCLKVIIVALFLISSGIYFTDNVTAANSNCADGTTMTANEAGAAFETGKVVITWTVQASQVVFHVNNTTGCQAPLIGSSYKVFIEPPNTGWLSTQLFLAESEIVNINANGNTDIAISIASCTTQADIWYQAAPHYFTSDDSSGFVGYNPVTGTILPREGLCVSCVSHSVKKCVDNAVYWFDSCDKKEELVETCSSNEICQNSQCLNITCSANTDCGTNAFTGDPFCQSGNVYQNFKTYTCNNPGTVASVCSNSTAPQLKNTCGTNQTCSNGSCNNTQSLTVSCFANPNPANVNQQVSFTAVPSGGLGSYLYSWTGACSSSSSTCYNSFSQAGTQTAVVYATSGSQTSNAVCAVNISQNCIQNHQQRCVGGNLYWFDSCGNQQALSQYCQSGCQNDACQIQQTITVQTNAATNISNSQATLNGAVYGVNFNNIANVWFQWGTTASYGYETQRQTQNNTGSFSQNIANLSAGTIYHFRAVAQNNLGNIFYGSDMTFTTGSAGPGGNLPIITKKVKNLSSGNLTWASSMPASPSDVVMFMIEIKANGNQNLSNAVIKDVLPPGLNYKGPLTVSGSTNYTGDINAGLNFATIQPGQTITITYEAQVASAQNFNYGTITQSNNVSLSASGLSQNPSASAAVVVTRKSVMGATDVPTGLTNNFLLDSFFLPLMIALAGVWVLKSDIFGFEKWIDIRRGRNKEYKIEKELKSKIKELNDK